MAEISRLRPGMVVRFAPESPLYAQGFRFATVVSVTETVGEFHRRRAPELGVDPAWLSERFRRRRAELGKDVPADWEARRLPVLALHPSPRCQVPGVQVAVDASHVDPAAEAGN